MYANDYYIGAHFENSAGGGGERHFQNMQISICFEHLPSLELGELGTI